MGGVREYIRGRFYGLQELSVALRDVPGAVHADVIVVKVSHLNHGACVGPLFVSFACFVLVLYEDRLADTEMYLLSGTFGQVNSFLHNTLGIRSCSVFCCLAPFLPRDELSGLEGEKVSQNSAINNLSWAQSRERAGSIAMEQ